MFLIKVLLDALYIAVNLHYLIQGDCRIPMVGGHGDDDSGSEDYQHSGRQQISAVCQSSDKTVIQRSRSRTILHTVQAAGAFWVDDLMGFADLEVSQA